MAHASDVTGKFSLMGGDVGTQAITFIDGVMSSTVVANGVFFCVGYQAGEGFK